MESFPETMKIMVSTFADLARMVASKYVDPNQQLPDVGFQCLDEGSPQLCFAVFV